MSQLISNTVENKSTLPSFKKGKQTYNKFNLVAHVFYLVIGCSSLSVSSMCSQDEVGRLKSLFFANSRSKSASAIAHTIMIIVIFASRQAFKLKTEYLLISVFVIKKMDRLVKYNYVVCNSQFRHDARASGQRELPAAGRDSAPQKTGTRIQPKGSLAEPMLKYTPPELPITSRFQAERSKQQKVND